MKFYKGLVELLLSEFNFASKIKLIPGT